MVNVDPPSTFVRLRTQYPGVLIDVGGAKDYVPVADAKIRRVKEMYPAVKAGLAWRLPKSRVSDLLTYCVSRLNLWRTSALQGVLSRVADRDRVRTGSSLNTGGPVVTWRTKVYFVLNVCQY